jgi:acetolactate synthase-1/2/3 large subunit
VLILNDNSYGMIRWKQANMGFKDWGLTYDNPDFVKYAESYGANGYRVSAAAELPALLEKCLNTPGVNLVEVPVDYSDNDPILNKQIKELSAKV